MFKTPYDTTLCKGLSIANIIRQLQRSYVSDMLILSDSIKGTQVKGVFVVPPSNTDVTQFKHPIVFTSPSVTDPEAGDWMVAIYGKGWMREDTRNNEYRIPNTYDSGVPLLGAALTKAWLQHSPLDMMNLGDLPGKVFTRWIAHFVTQREMLSAEAMKWVNAYAALYWLMLFEESPVNLHDDVVLRQYCNKIGQITRINNNEIYIRFSEEEFGPILNIHSLVELIKRADPLRLERMDAGLLYSYLQNTFMGAAQRESVAIALEYPPLFNALLIQAMTDRSYRKTKISELAEMQQRTERDVYLRNVANLIEV